MAIFKTGDAQPIKRFYDEDGNEMKCPRCGRTMVVVAIKDGNNEPVCEECDLNEDE